MRILATITTALGFVACGTSPTSPTTPAPAEASAGSKTSAFVATFNENPVPFRSTGCNASTPQGWYTTARLQETAGVNFTPRTLIQKLDGNVASFLVESFSSRFGACTGSTVNEGVIPGNATACGSVGVCTSSTYSTYQFQITGADANGHSVTFDSPMLQLAARSTTQSIPFLELAVPPITTAPSPRLQ